MKINKTMAAKWLMFGWVFIPVSILVGAFKQLGELYIIAKSDIIEKDHFDFDFKNYN